MQFAACSKIRRWSLVSNSNSHICYPQIKLLFEKQMDLKMLASCQGHDKTAALTEFGNFGFTPSAWENAIMEHLNLIWSLNWFIALRSRLSYVFNFKWILINTLYHLLNGLLETSGSLHNLNGHCGFTAATWFHIFQFRSEFSFYLRGHLVQNQLRELMVLAF
jgi:hypothetical protein